MNDRRTAGNEASVRKLRAYLLGILKEPANYLDDETLRKALSSQGALARLHLPEAGVTPMSLNTAKRAARDALDGGYVEIDRLRLDCAEALAAARLASAARSTRETRQNLRRRAELAEQQVQLLSEDLQLATGLIRECMRQARTYAKRADAATQSLCEKEQRNALRTLGLLRNRPE